MTRNKFTIQSDSKNRHLQILMPVVVDLYTPRQSWVHAIDPRVKLLFVACFILLLLVFNNLFFMLTTC